MSKLTDLQEVPYLSNLGVSFEQQAVSPTSAVYPITFNPHNQSCWDLAIKNIVPTDNPLMDWGSVIQYYLDECERQGRYPFSNVHQSVNDQISNELNVARKAVVKFINNFRLLNMITFRDTHRKVSMTNSGFILTVHGVAKLKDPTFPQWLTSLPGPRFDIMRTKDGKYTKHLLNNTTFFAYNEGANLTDRWHVGYEIVINKFPDIPNRRTPSKAELERFILDILWMPTLKQLRPNGLSHKLL